MMPAARVTPALDTFLDRTVVLGYTWIGPRLRRHWWPSDPAPHGLVGKRVVVTGASSGLGKAASRGLAELGATVHMLGRDQQRLREAAAAIVDTVPDAALVTDRCDVSDLDQVRAYAGGLAEQVESVHALLHVAGVLPPERTESAQGHELTLATHVLGPLLMTELLRDRLRPTSGPGRVVWVSSGGMYAHPFTHEVATDLELTGEDYNGTTAYARTKRMQVIVAERLAERLAGEGTVVHSMHPGWSDTPGATDALPRFATLMRPLLRTPAEGADTIVWLAGSPEAARSTGAFWCDRRPRPTTYLPWQREHDSDRALLWDYCTKVVGVSG